MSDMEALQASNLRLSGMCYDLTAERDRLAAAVDAVMADRRRILEERDRTFALMLARAEAAEADNARLLADLERSKRLRDQYREALDAERKHSSAVIAALNAIAAPNTGKADNAVS